VEVDDPAAAAPAPVVVVDDPAAVDDVADAAVLAVPEACVELPELADDAPLAAGGNL
jgi:hypothetical protein